MNSTDSDVDTRLAQLEAASDERRRRLAEVMQNLPAEVSRREIVRDSLADLRSGSTVEFLRRGARAVAALPRRLAGRLRTLRER